MDSRLLANSSLRTSDSIGVSRRIERWILSRMDLFRHTPVYYYSGLNCSTELLEGHRLRYRGHFAGSDDGDSWHCRSSRRSRGPAGPTSPLRSGDSRCPCCRPAAVQGCRCAMDSGLPAGRPLPKATRQAETDLQGLVSHLPPKLGIPSLYYC